LLATGEANAHLTAETELSLDASKLIGGITGGSPEVAGALAITDANTISHVTVAKGATITAGTTANIIASGNSTSDAEASSGLFADGKAGLAFALDFSNSDIKTSVDGTVIARADPVAGYTVKIEIDPLAGLNADGTPQVGYVDYANNRIYVGPNALVDEDVITYTNRRGTSIGGLVDGRQYFIVTTDEPGWIQLAETQTNALRAIAGFPAGNVVDLRTDLGPATSDNTLSFDSSNVDSGTNTISLQRNGATVFNTFELGQAVVYRATPGSSIEGLVDGVMPGRAQGPSLQTPSTSVVRIRALGAAGHCGPRVRHAGAWLRPGRGGAGGAGAGHQPATHAPDPHGGYVLADRRGRPRVDRSPHRPHQSSADHVTHLDRTLVEPRQLRGSTERVLLVVDVIAIDAIGVTRIA